MLRIRRISIMQQAALSIALGLTSAVAWFGMPRYHEHPGHSAYFFAITFTVGLGAFIVALYLANDLRAGAESGRWPEQQIECFRSVCYSPLAWALFLALTLSGMLIIAFGLLYGHARGAGYGLLMVSQVLAQLAGPRRPKTSSGSREVVRKLAPITSEHWGQAD